MNKLQSEITCPCCQNIFDTPLLLPCGHSICSKCIGKTRLFNESQTEPVSNSKTSFTEDTLSEADSGVVVLCGNNSSFTSHGSVYSNESNGSNNSTYTFVNVGTQKKYITCYTCQNRFKLKFDKGTGLIDLFPRNLSLENLIRRLIQNGPSPNTAQCQLCQISQDPVESNRFCEQCNLWYCPSCLQNWHPTSEVLIKHQIRSFEELGIMGNKVRKTESCSKHQISASNCLYCNTCAHFICPQCLTNETDHRSPNCLTSTFMPDGIKASTHAGHLICSANVYAKNKKVGDYIHITL